MEHRGKGARQGLLDLVGLTALVLAVLTILSQVQPSPVQANTSAAMLGDRLLSTPFQVKL